jgi:hypothetical protein
MKRTAVFAITILWSFACTLPVFAQAPSGPPKPGPEQQKLAYFAGKWTSEGDMKASIFGPAGKFSFEQNCDWFTGGLALVCHTDGKMLGGTVKSLSIIGYDLQEQTYTYFETNTLGENLFSRGTFEGDTWTWTNEGKMNGKPIRGRFIMKQVSPDTATYRFELGAGDEPLKVVMEGKQTRVK